MNVSQKNKETIRESLIIRRNLIETGDPSLSKADAENILNSQKRSPAIGQIKVKIKVLSLEQQQLVEELNQLINNFI